MLLILAFIGFIALTLACLFYIPRCTALVFAIYIFIKLAIQNDAIFMKTVNTFGKTFGDCLYIPVGIVFAILACIMIYLDLRNLHLNPFKK